MTVRGLFVKILRSDSVWVLRIGLDSILFHCSPVCICMGCCIYMNLVLVHLSFMHGENNFPVADGWRNSFEVAMIEVFLLLHSDTLLLWEKSPCGFAGDCYHHTPNTLSQIASLTGIMTVAAVTCPGDSKGV